MENSRNLKTRVVKGRSKSPTGKTTEKSSAQAKVLFKTLLSIIDNKKCTYFDFLKLSRKFPESIELMYITSDDGLNILQICIVKGRLSYLPVLVQLGWWSHLSSTKVVEDASSEHRGKTAKQIAESKGTRKVTEEFTIQEEWEKSLTALMKSCRSGDASGARQILQSGGVDIFTLDSNHGHALYWTVVRGDLQLFQDLVEMGLDVNMRTKKGETLLHVACNMGQHHMVSLLIQTYGIDPWKKDISHKTCIDRTAENGDIESLKSIINCGIQPKPNVASLAAFADRSPFVVHLIDVLKIAVDSPDIYDRTAFHRSLEGGNLGIAKYLVTRGADVSLITKMGRNVLHIVAEEGSEEIMKWLLLVLEEKAMLKSMIDVQDRYNGVDLCFLIRGRDKGRDAFHYVEVERSKVPTFLKRTKAGNVDVAEFGRVLKSDWGVNPTQETIDEIEDIFKCRRLNMSAEPDQTPLHIAIAKNHFGVAKLLIEKEANIHQRDKFGQTALFLAVSRGSLELVSLLEQKGADFNLLDHNRKSLYDIAEENQQDAIINFLSGRNAFDFIENFRVGHLEHLNQMISKQQLEKQRNEGTNMKRYLTDHFRHITTEINKLLVSLDSGPIVEETGDGPSECAPKANPHHPQDCESGIGSLHSNGSAEDTSRLGSSANSYHDLSSNTTGTSPMYSHGHYSSTCTSELGSSLNSEDISQREYGSGPQHPRSLGGLRPV